MRLFVLCLIIAGTSSSLWAQSADVQQCAQKIAKAMVEKAAQTSGKAVRLDYFTFGDTEMGSFFSREMYNALAIELPKAGISVRENSNDLALQKTWLQKDEYAICGIYQNRKGGIEVQACLFDLKKKQAIRFVKEAIPTDVLTKQQIAWKPAKFEQASRTRNLIVEEDEASPAPAPQPIPDPLPSPVPPLSHGDFLLEMISSKGAGHQIFIEGERMRIAVKTAHACFLRLVYHAADGQKVLLLENVPMTVSDAGNYITVPQDFECSAPFGVETLQLFASTAIFPPLKTHAQDGFVFIDEDVATVNVKTRSFKPVATSPKKEHEPFLKAEVSLQVTTLPK